MEETNVVFTPEGASQTDLDGEQINDSRVGAKINCRIKQNLGYGFIEFLLKWQTHFNKK